jgi:hypothetical protein
MKSFYHYLAESDKSYQYRVKAVVPMDAQFVETVKKTLFKYNVQEVSKPKKTPIQRSPLDFREFENAEVWILDITTKVPASSYVLATELRGALKLVDRMLIVRGVNEPVELEAQAIEEIHKDTEALLTDSEYKEAQPVEEVAFGDTYNTRFLDYLAQLRANAAKDAEEPAVQEVKKTNRFAWLNPKDDKVADDFNADIPGVKPVHVNSKKPGAEAQKPNMTGNTGAYETAKRKG